MTFVYLAQSALWVAACAGAGYVLREAYEEWKASNPWLG